MQSWHHQQIMDANPKLKHYLIGMADVRSGWRFGWRSSFGYKPPARSLVGTMLSGTPELDVNGVKESKLKSFSSKRNVSVRREPPGHGAPMVGSKAAVQLGSLFGHTPLPATGLPRARRLKALDLHSRHPRSPGPPPHQPATQPTSQP